MRTRMASHRRFSWVPGAGTPAERFGKTNQPNASQLALFFQIGFVLPGRKPICENKPNLGGQSQSSVVPAERAAREPGSSNHCSFVDYWVPAIRVPTKIARHSTRTRMASHRRFSWVPGAGTTAERFGKTNQSQFGRTKPIAENKPKFRLQPLAEKANQARRQEAGVAGGFLDRIVQPVMRRALHDAGAHEEVRLLEPHEEGVGLRAAVHQIVLGADAQEHSHLIVGEDRIVDRRRVEIKPWIVHRRGAHEILDVVLARAL